MGRESHFYCDGCQDRKKPSESWMLIELVDWSAVPDKDKGKGGAYGRTAILTRPLIPDEFREGWNPDRQKSCCSNQCSVQVLGRLIEDVFNGNENAAREKGPWPPATRKPPAAPLPRGWGEKTGSDG